MPGVSNSTKTRTPRSRACSTIAETCQARGGRKAHRTRRPQGGHRAATRGLQGGEPDGGEPDGGETDEGEPDGGCLGEQAMARAVEIHVLTSPWVYRCDGAYAACDSFGYVELTNGNDCVSTRCQCSTLIFANGSESMMARRLARGW